MGNVRFLQCKLIIQQPFIRDVYNFVRIHKTLKITPPTATKVTGRLSEIGDIVDVLEVLRDGPMKLFWWLEVNMKIAIWAVIALVVVIAAGAGIWKFTHTDWCYENCCNGKPCPGPPQSK